MAVQLELTSNIFSDCGYAKLEDISAYGVSPNSRSDFGIAIFVQLPDTSYDYSLSDLSNSDPWYIPIQNNTEYSFKGYQLPIWVAGVYVQNDVVFYDGLFYYCSDAMGAIATDIPDPSSIIWTEVPNDLTGKTLIVNASLSYFNIKTTQECPNYTLTKNTCPDTSICCRSWKLCDNSGNDNKKDIALFDYNLNFRKHYVIDPLINTCVDINVPEQGVWIVGIKDSNGAPVLNQDQWTRSDEYTDFFVIYEYCQLTNCFQYLVDQILCSGDPCVEICNPCDHSKILLDRNNRLEINKMVALFGTLLGMINAERIKYLGIYDMDVTRANFVSQIGMYFVKINEISIRCGICIGQEVKSTDNAVFNEVIRTSQNRGGCTNC